MPTPVRFAYGTYQDYKTIQPEEGVLYFITDRGLIFRQNDIVTQNIEVESFTDSSGYECFRFTDNTGWTNPIIYEIYSIPAIQSIIQDYTPEYTPDPDMMRYKGVIPSGQDVPTNSYKKGDVYRVEAEGLYANQRCDANDFVLAVRNGPTSGSMPIQTDWTVIQGNIIGAVTVPRYDYELDSSAVIVGNGLRTVRKVDHPTKPDHFLGLDSSLNPTWRPISSIIPIPLGVPVGGTGKTSFADGSALIGNGANPIQTKRILTDTIVGFQDSSALATTEAIWKGIQSLSNFIDSSCWSIGDDSSAMNGWEIELMGNDNSVKHYFRNVYLGDLVLNRKLDINLYLTIENTLPKGYPVEIRVEFSGNSTMNPLSTQIQVQPMETSNVSLCGIMIPQALNQNDYINISLFTSQDAVLIIRQTTPQSNAFINASVLTVRSYN